MAGLAAMTVSPRRQQRCSCAAGRGCAGWAMIAASKRCSAFSPVRFKFPLTQLRLALQGFAALLDRARPAAAVAPASGWRAWLAGPERRSAMRLLFGLKFGRDLGAKLLHARRGGLAGAWRPRQRRHGCRGRRPAMGAVHQRGCAPGRRRNRGHRRGGCGFRGGCAAVAARRMAADAPHRSIFKVIIGTLFELRNGRLRSCRSFLWPKLG